MKRKDRRTGTEKRKIKKKKRKPEIQRRIRGDKKKSKGRGARGKRENARGEGWKRRLITVLVSSTTGAGRTAYKTPSRRCIECNFHLRADPSFPPVFSMPIQMADRPPRFVRLTRVREKASIVTLNSKVDEGRESRGFGNLTNRRWKIRGFKNLVIWKIETSYTRLEIVANSTIFYSRA